MAKIYPAVRVCLACGKSYEHFGQRMARCRGCKQQYDRDYHAKRSATDKRRKQDLQTVRQNANAKFVFDYLCSHPCVICGETDPVVLEFDHIVQQDKEFCISTARSFSLGRIKTEIAKCRVLCANCHRRHTAQQLGWYKNWV